MTLNQINLCICLLFTNRKNTNCMKVLGSGNDRGIFQKYTSLPGEIYDADSQCRHISGQESSFCKVTKTI